MGETRARVSVEVGTKAETAPVDRYTSSVQRMRNAIRDVFTSKAALAGGAAFGGSFAAAGLSVQAMVSRITEAVSGSSELASELAQVQRRVGLAGEAFQVLSRSGKVAAEELIAAFAKYRVKLGDALAGDKSARALFAGLGISPEAQTRLPMERQLETLGVALGRFKDENRQAAAAQEFFGRGYTSMVPLLGRLRTEGYDRLRESVTAAAGILDNQMSGALNKAKRESLEATNQLTIGLAEANLRILQLKASVTKMLADNAGTIESAGSGIARGFITAAILSQIVSRVGPQLNVIGSQSALAFNKGFGVGARLLPGIIAGSLTSTGALASFAALGRAIATPFGAALAVAVGVFLINELERVALEEIERRDKTLARGSEEVNALRGRVRTAATADDANKTAADAAALLNQRRTELETLETRSKKLEEARKAAIEAQARTPNVAIAIPGDLNPADQTQIQSLRQEIPLLERLVALAQTKGQAIAAANAAAQAAADKAAAEKEELTNTRAQRETLLEREKQNRYEALTTDRDRLAFLLQWRTAEEQAGQAKLTATTNAELRSDHELELRVKIADIDAKIAQLRKSIADDTNKSVEAAQKELDELFDALARATRQNTIDASETKLRKLAQDRATLDGDFRRTEAEKWTERRKMIADEIALREDVIRQLRAQRDSVTDLDAIRGYDSDIRGQSDQISGLNQEAAGLGPNPTNWVDQTAAALTQIRDDWGTTAQQIAATISGTINTAIDATSASITGLIMGTMTWHNALQNIALTIVTSIVQSIVQMGIRWVATQIMMAVMSKSILAANTAATIPLAMAQAAVWSAPATLATIATYGGAAVAAPGFIATANAITKAMTMVPGFEEGGYTFGRPGEVAGIVHGGEFVFSAPAVQNMGGPEEFEALHRAALNPASPSAGFAATGRDRPKPVRFIHVMAPDFMSAKRLAQDPDFDNVMCDWASRNKGEILGG